jgi:hypothetical protein
MNRTPRKPRTRAIRNKKPISRDRPLKTLLLGPGPRFESLVVNRGALRQQPPLNIASD